MPRSRKTGAQAALHKDEQLVIEFHEQTAHKLDVLRRAVGAYLGIIAQAGTSGSFDATRIFLTDACCGAGSHLSKDNPRSQVPGTAVQLCIDARAIQRNFPGTSVSVRLIDVDQGACDRVGLRVAEYVDAALAHPDRIDVRVIRADFASHITPILAEAERPGGRYCNLWIFDPFDVSTIPRASIAPLLTAGRGTEVVINLDAGGAARLRRAVYSMNSTAEMRKADGAILDRLYGDDRWRHVVPAGATWEDEVHALAEAYAATFQPSFAYRNVYPLRVSDNQVRYLVHLTHVKRAREAFRKAYDATLPRARKSRALDMTARDNAVAVLHSLFKGKRAVPFADMTGLKQYPLDRGQLIVVLRRARDSGYGTPDEKNCTMTWFMKCLNPPALPLDLAQHTERRRSRKAALQQLPLPLFGDTKATP